MVRHISDALLVQKILQQDPGLHMWDSVEGCRQGFGSSLLCSGYLVDCPPEFEDNGTFGDDSAYLDGDL